MKKLVYVVLALIILCKSTTIKKRLCVEYQIQNSRRSGSILDTIHNMDGPQCLLKCADNPECKAYNLWRENGTCELLPKLKRCAEPVEHHGWTFIHLGPCLSRMPWTVGRFDRSAATSCLLWKRRDIGPGIMACPANALWAPKTPGRCASVFPDKGFYLPGWYRDGTVVRMITGHGEAVRCKGSGYMLAERPECPVTWQEYTAGDLIPNAAVPLGAWKNGIPLYLVRAGEYFGYYQPSAQTNFIHNGSTASPLEVDMLVARPWINIHDT